MFFNNIVKIIKQVKLNKCTLNPLSAVIRHMDFFPLFLSLLIFYVYFCSKYMTRKIMNATIDISYNQILALAQQLPVRSQLRLGKYLLKLAEERLADPTEMSKEEFYHRIDHSRQQAREGKVGRISSKEELTQFLNSL